LASQNLSEKFDILIPTAASGNVQPGQGLEAERVTPKHLSGELPFRHTFKNKNGNRSSRSDSGWLRTD
jgi:hypothetical protein